MQRVEVDSVDFFGPPDQPPRLAMLLGPTGHGRYLPVWIGKEVGESINSALVGRQSTRPMTHDLLKSAVESSGGVVEHVAITECRDRTYYAELRIRDGRSLRTVDSRPSDAVALAVRCGCPVLVADPVMDRYGLELPPIAGTVEPSASGVVLRLDAPLDGSEAAGSIELDHYVVESLSLTEGDRIVGRAAIPRDGVPTVPLTMVDIINGRMATVEFDLARVGIPVTLVVPNGWFGLFQGIFQPFGFEAAEVSMWAGLHDAPGLDAPGVLERIIADSDGAYERLEDDGTFEVPAGIEATMLTHVSRTVSAQPGDDVLLPGMHSLAGATIRWVAHVANGRALVAGLEAVDWDRWRSVEPILSRLRIHTGTTDPGDLTDREVEVLNHIAGGATNAQIAERLEISPHTVGNHVRSILAKLEAANRTQAASYGFARGIIEDASRN